MAKHRNDGSAPLLTLEAAANPAATPNALSPAAMAPRTDALSVLDGLEFEADGLDAASAEDYRFPRMRWNVHRQDETGRKTLCRVDQFLNTVTEEVADELTCTFIHLYKRNEWKRFDGERNRIVCASNDRVHATLREDHPQYGPAGTQRRCEGCPDATWRQVMDEKTGQMRNVRPCNLVYSVVAVGADGQPFIIEFQKAAANTFRSYLQKHHLGRRRVGNSMANVPLFAFEAIVRLRMDRGGKFASPEIERGRVLSRDEMLALQALAQQLRDRADHVFSAEEPESEPVVAPAGEPYRGEFVEAEGAGAEADAIPF